MAVAGDVLVELDVHDAIFGERVHGARLGLARLEKAQRLRDRHLVDEDLVAGQRRLGDAVAGLDDRRFRRVGGRGDVGGLGEEGADRDRVGGVVGALVDHLEHVVGTDDRRGHLHAAGAPAVGHRHFARGEGNLIAGNGDRLEDGAADHPLRLLVEIGEVVGPGGHSAASFAVGRRRAGRESFRFRLVSVFRSELAQQRQLGLEVDVMGQFQVLDEAGRLHVVAMGEHEFLVLRRADPLLGEFVGAQRAIDQGHRHRLALALAEGQAIAAGEARRLAVAAAGELVDHLAFGDGDRPERNGEAELGDEHFDLDLAEADLADERMVAAVAALGRIAEPEQKALVAARQRLQPRVAGGGEFGRVAGDVGDRRAVLGRRALLDQVVAGDDVDDARRRRARLSAGAVAGGGGSAASPSEKSISRWV